MSDEVIENSVEHEVAPVETTETNVAETQKDTQAEDRQERNWRAMRQRQEELEREIKRRDEMMEKLISMQMPPKTQEVEEPEEPDDEFISKGKVKKVAHKAVAPLEKRIHDLEARLEQKHKVDLMQDLRRRYPDFEDVVNQETLSLFEEKEPELATAIAESKDPYKMGIQSYKYIKALKLAEEVPNARHAREVERKAEKNAKTVQSPTNFDKRPMAQAFRMTEAEKSALYQEMNQFASMAGSVPEMS